jgi:hypothetical protein
MKATLYSFFKKAFKFNKQLEIYNFGVENNIPENLDLLIDNAGTAKYCANQMVQYLIGKGLGEFDDILINENQRLYDFLELIAKSKVKFSGVYIGISYGFDAEKYFISDAKVLPYENCRIGKQDDKFYNGKICVYKDLNNKKDSAVWYDVFNDNPNVLEAQINQAGSFQKYKGQVLFVSDDETKIYPTSRISGSIEMDCENEIQIARYKNQILKNGFFGKTLILTKPLIDRNIPKEILSENGELIYNSEYRIAESERENFKETIKDFCGAENIGGALHLELDFDNEDIDKQIKFINIESKIDPNLFTQIEKISVENICKAFNNYPIGLLQNSSGGLNASGEQIKELKRLYWENTEKERNQLERLINKIWAKHEKYNGQYLKIQPYEFVTNEVNQ